MTKSTIVEIPPGSGNKYRYRYNSTTGKMDYIGPVGDAPILKEDEFLKGLKRVAEKFDYEQRDEQGREISLDSITIIDGRTVESVENVTPKRNWPYIDLWKVKFKTNLWIDESGELRKDSKSVHMFFRDGDQWEPISPGDLKKMKERW